MNNYLAKILFFVVSFLPFLGLNAAQFGDTIMSDGGFYLVMDGGTNVCLVGNEDAKENFPPHRTGRKRAHAF